MIRLKVPKKPAAESVSIGYFYAEFKPGKVLETESREFADYLIANFDCEEVCEKTEAPAPAEGGDA